MLTYQYRSEKFKIWVKTTGYRVLPLTIMLLIGCLSIVDSQVIESTTSAGLSAPAEYVQSAENGYPAPERSAGSVEFQTQLIENQRIITERIQTQEIQSQETQSQRIKTPETQPEKISPHGEISNTQNTTVRGVVFDDWNQNGVRDAGEPGVSGVLVSNGRSFVRTGTDGSYSIELIPNHDLTIVQPSGWRVPTDHRMVPQFFYIHKPEGTGYEMRFGGLPPTGPAPQTINFPLTRSGAAGDDFTCVAMGDPQTYSNEQLGFLRNGVFNDLKQRGLSTSDCLIYVGDVVGDDLDLMDRLLELGAGIGAQQWLVLGNHDVDFDARSNDDKADSWRRIFGPNYYAFEQGNVLFVVLDNVFYPCTEEDFARGRENCDPSRNPSYNGRLTETQLQWLEALINETPPDRLIVLSHHIPFVSFVDATSKQHQTDDMPRIYAMLEGRQVLSLSGHTHTIENHAPGQVFEGWNEAVGVSALPFRHIVVGAASGAWYQGDFSVDGVPMALQRMGAPMGYVDLSFSGSTYTERYIGSRLGEHRGQWVSLNTPDFRSWFDEIINWWRTPAAERAAVPPRSIHDLPDPQLLIPDDFTRDDGVWLKANVWMGSAETRVHATMPDGSVLELHRTQQGEGEAVQIGAEWADPFATMRQLTVARHAIISESGEEKAQGFELFRGRRIGPGAPMPQSSISDRNMHLWRAQLPELQPGVYPIRVTSTDRNGQTYTDVITVEVHAERPPKHWRGELWR